MNQRHHFGGGEAPPWWPEGEAWPPERGPWSGVRHRFMRRIGLLLIGLFAALIGVFVLGAILFGQHRGGGPQGGDEWNGPPIFGIVFLLGGAYVIYRILRRTTAPVSELMEATGRLAEGDYTTRVQPRGSSESKELGRAFNALAERLEQNESQRRALIADVTHELRTPLSVIRGAAEGIIDGVYPGDTAHVTPIVEEVELMARLLNDLATLSRAEAGQLELQKERVSPYELAEEAVAAFHPRFGAAGVSLSNEVPERLPAIDADPLRLRQVLTNLLANALQHTPAGGSVTIAGSVSTDRDRVVLRVSDTGAGIPADQLPHIFERFRKAEESPGSGLGLAIARSFVEAHDGTIRAASTEGQGTTITVELPAAEQK